MRKSPFVLFSLALFSLAIAGLFFWWGYNLQPIDKNSKEKVSLSVSKGDSLTEISENLKNKGLIRNSLHFKIYSLLLGSARKIKAGNYYLSFSMTPREICRDLTKGISDQWVTVVEGLRSEQIGELFFKAGFAVNLVEWEEQVKKQGLEGRLFPDSYLIPVGAGQKKIFQIFEKNFQKKVTANVGYELQKSGFSLGEVLTLASIVEREVKHDLDRAIVAGILLKRLKNSWPLQVDASVQYAVGTQKCASAFSDCEWWPSTLGEKDLKIISPFNTYINKGLPPGPICNPGLSSIKAVLQPRYTDYWFYLSDKKGVMHYGQTIEEHASNIEKYLK